MTRQGAYYFITLINERTRFRFVYLFSFKLEASDCFRCFVNLVENQNERPFSQHKS